MGTVNGRVISIDGRAVLAVDRTRPIPDSLSLLLEGGRDRRGRVWNPVRMTHRYPLALAGTRAQCLQEDHRLGVWVEGFHSGSDGVSRFLALMACRDCGAVCVRDRSFDSLDGLRLSGRRPLRRKDEIIGWYSGARPGQRTYV